MYLPFFIADEFLREKIQETRFSLVNFVKINDSVDAYRISNVIEKDKTKLKRTNLLKNIINEYVKYKKGNSI
jgi:hypothetical protein